jgi:multidrug efflux pump
MPLVENGEIQRLLVRSPREFGNFDLQHRPWPSRPDGLGEAPAFEIMNDARQRWPDLPACAFAVMRQAFGGGGSRSRCSS